MRYFLLPIVKCNRFSKRDNQFYSFILFWLVLNLMNASAVSIKWWRFTIFGKVDWRITSIILYHSNIIRNFTNIKFNENNLFSANSWSGDILHVSGNLIYLKREDKLFSVQIYQHFLNLMQEFLSSALFWRNRKEHHTLIV